MPRHVICVGIQNQLGIVMNAMVGFVLHAVHIQNSELNIKTASNGGFLVEIWRIHQCSGHGGQGRAHGAHTIEVGGPSEN